MQEPTLRRETAPDGPIQQAATLITSLDAAPVNKMVSRPVSKKEKQWVRQQSRA